MTIDPRYEFDTCYYQGWIWGLNFFGGGMGEGKSTKSNKIG